MAHGVRPAEASTVAISQWPFVGRASILDAVDAALRADRTAAVLLCGPAGVGKTRLGHECADRAAACGHPVARVSANRALDRIPLGALVALLTSEEAGPVSGGADLSSIADDFLKLFDLARRVVSALGRGRRLVLLVDDLLALDSLSVALLAQLVEVGAVVLVATIGDGEAVPDAFLGLWSGDRALRVDVPLLRRGECHALLAAALGGTLSASCVAGLYRASRGNALYLRELVFGALADGSLSAVNGAWRLHRPPAASVALRDLLAGRLAKVTDPVERAVLERLALCHSLAVDEFPAEADRAALARLEEMGFVRLAEAGERVFAELSHPQYAQVLRARLSRLRANALLMEQAELVGRRPGDDVDALRVASWRLTAAGTADPELLLRAARLARMTHDFSAVQRLAGAAAGAIAVISGGAELLLLLGEAQGELGLPQEALVTLARAAELPASPPVAARLAIARATILTFHHGRPDEALVVLTAARQALPDHGAMLAYAAAGLFGDADQTDAALAELDSVRPLGRRGIDWAMAVVPALATAGRTDEAVAVAAEAVAGWHGTKHGVARHGSEPLMAQALALSEDGRLVDAVTAARQALAQALDDGLDRSACAAGSRLAGVFLLVGRPRSAYRLYRDVVSGARSYGLDSHWQLGLCGLTVAAAWLGDRGAARAAFTDLPPAGEAVGAWRIVARSWLSAAEWNIPDAVQLLETGGDQAHERGQFAVAAALWHDVARLGRPELIAPRLAALAAGSRSPFIQARAAHATALAGRDAVGLAATADAFERMGAMLFAAEVAAHAAQVAGAAGSRRSATALMNRATALSHRCEGARTPALLVADSIEPLTSREREIAMMAAAGMPSREIAERLTLSVRTVDNHLRAAYQKLGVSSRAELRSALQLVS